MKEFLTNTVRFVIPITFGIALIFGIRSGCRNLHSSSVEKVCWDENDDAVLVTYGGDRKAVYRHHNEYWIDKDGDEALYASKFIEKEVQRIAVWGDYCRIHPDGTTTTETKE